MATYGGGIVFSSNNSVFTDTPLNTTNVLYTVPATSNIYTEFFILSSYLMTSGVNVGFDIYIENDNGNGGYVRNPTTTFNKTYSGSFPSGTTEYIGILLTLYPGQRVVVVQTAGSGGTVRVKANNIVFTPST